MQRGCREINRRLEQENSARLQGLSIISQHISNVNNLFTSSAVLFSQSFSRNVSSRCVSLIKYFQVISVLNLFYYGLLRGKNCSIQCTRYSFFTLSCFT